MKIIVVQWFMRDGVSEVKVVVFRVYGERENMYGEGTL